jgi:hypothetical protein
VSAFVLYLTIIEIVPSVLCGKRGGWQRLADEMTGLHRDGRMRWACPLGWTGPGSRARGGCRDHRGQRQGFNRLGTATKSVDCRWPSSDVRWFQLDEGGTRPPGVECVVLVLQVRAGVVLVCVVSLRRVRGRVLAAFPDCSRRPPAARLRRWLRHLWRGQSHLPDPLRLRRTDGRRARVAARVTGSRFETPFPSSDELFDALPAASRQVPVVGARIQF